MTRDDKIKQARIEYLQSEIRGTAAAFEREMARVEKRVEALQAEIDRLEAEVASAVR